MQKNRRAQIKEVAQMLFRERGYAATSMRDVAKKVGIEAASLYSHISSKEQILSEICFSMADEFFEELEPIRFEPTTASKKLKKAIQAHLKVISNNLDASAVFLHDWRFLSPEPLAKFKSRRSTYEYYFRDILQEGIQSGEFKEVRLKVFLPTLFSAMNWTYEWYKPNGEASFEQIADEIFNLVYNGIKK